MEDPEQILIHMFDPQSNTGWRLAPPNLMVYSLGGRDHYMHWLNTSKSGPEGTRAGIGKLLRRSSSLLAPPLLLIRHSSSLSCRPSRVDPLVLTLSLHAISLGCRRLSQTVSRPHATAAHTLIQLTCQLTRASACPRLVRLLKVPWLLIHLPARARVQCAHPLPLQ